MTVTKYFFYKYKTNNDEYEYATDIFDMYLDTYVNKKIKNKRVLDYNSDTVTVNKRIKTNTEMHDIGYEIRYKEIENKRKKTNIEKFGVEYPMQSEEIKNKRRKTYDNKNCILLDKYSIDHTYQTAELRQNKKKTMEEIIKKGIEKRRKLRKLKELEIQLM